MPGVREFFQTGKGQAVVGVFVLVALAAAAYTVLGGGTPAELQNANTRIFVDSENNKSFSVDLSKAKIPAISPFTGKATGYPAELCYWTKEGTPKAEPTGVLMNAIKGIQGPTFCPDCGRLVVPYNPKAGPGVKVPPTKAEYAASGRNNE